MKFKELLDKKIKSNLLSLVILIGIGSLAIGYAAMELSLNITGTLTSKVEDGVFIYKVSYNDSESLYVDSTLSNHTFSKTMLHNRIVLSDAKIESKITYDVEIYNNNAYYVFLSKPTNEKGNPEGANLNDDIVFEISRKAEDGQYVALQLDEAISETDIIPPKTMAYLRITFSYKAGLANITNNILDSYIKFNFIYDATYNCNGKEQVYIAPVSGTYKIELWGAGGGGGPTSRKCFS